MVAPAEDRWPASTASPTTRSGRSLLASHLLGADRAVANFGGGNTSAKGTATDHVGREVDVMWVKGSGSDLATMGREHFTPLRLDEMLPLLERDEMSDEDMVAHLARCQTDPAAPRSSIETLLHAFVPAAHVHHTHPDGINVLAGSEDGEQLVRECFGDEAAWIPYIRPGLHARQAGRRGGAREPGPAARRARQARARGVGRHRRGGLPAHDRGDQPGGRLRQRATPATRRASAGAAAGGDPATCCAARAAGAPRRRVLSEQPKMLVVDTSPRAARVRRLARRASG